MDSEPTADERVNQVQAESLSFKDLQRQENIATASRWSSIGVGAALAARGGPVALAAYAAGVTGGFAGSWLAEQTGAPELAAKAFELFGMHRVGQGKTQAATVSHQVAHSYGFAGLIAGLVAGAVAALAVGALIVATGGAAAVVVVGAAAAGGLTGGFLGTTLGGALAKMGSPTGPIVTGSPNVFVGGMPVARMTDTAACIKEPVPSPIVEGSSTIFVNSLPMVRVGHKLACGASVDEGFRSVFLDQTTIACAAPASDVPLWARLAADWIVFVPWGKLASKLSARAKSSSVREVNLEDVRSSQGDVSPRMRDGRTIDEVASEMRQNGWDKTKEPPDMVEWDDGSLTTLDHRRLVAADRGGLGKVPARVHPADEHISADRAKRYQLRQAFTDPDTGKVWQPGDVPTTWGEAGKFRAANQRGRGYPDFPLKGQQGLPRVKE